MKTKEYREKIAEAFLKSLQEDPVCWKQQWKSLSYIPRNLVTEKPYRGINRLWLSYVQQEGGFKDYRWCTFRQLQDKGWHLKKGSKSVQVEYWMPFDTEEKKVITWEEYEKREEKENIKLVARYHHVFNGDQIEGIPQLKMPEENDIHAADVVTALSENMGVEILHDGGSSAFYRKSEDKIHLPKMEYFDDDYAYNATALHELAHATGHASRLNRYLDGGFGSDYYAYEELVAEISSCFMGHNLPVAMDEEHFLNHKAYIQGWIDGISQKPEILIKAVKDAQAASDYMEFKAGILSEREYRKEASLTFEVSKKKIHEYSEEAAEEQKRNQLLEDRNRKGYVKEYISTFLAGYDFEHPKRLLGRDLPALMMEKDFLKGGICATEEDCKMFINRDPEAAFNTLCEIRECGTELSGITPETHPRKFSLLMMERELMKMLQESPYIAEHFHKELVFDRKTAAEICEKNRIKLPDNVRRIKLCVPGVELE